MAHPRVTVLMSTYNGEEYLADQIESILCQTIGKPLIIVRDDGSTDGTLKILRHYAASGDIELHEGHNLGVTASFLRLINLAPKTIPYIAFSDQDDIWHSNKLERALHMIDHKDPSKPCLYFAEYSYCDAEMNVTGKSHLNKTGVCFTKMLLENITSGNTMVFNRRLADLIVDGGVSGVYCHDWWVSLIASALGEIVYDDFDCLDYRRTGHNASPSGRTAFELLLYRIKVFLIRDGLEKIHTQLKTFSDLYGSMLQPKEKNQLDRLLHGSRMSKAFSPFRMRQTFSGEAAVRALMLFGLL